MGGKMKRKTKTNGQNQQTKEEEEEKQKIVEREGRRRTIGAPLDKSGGSVETQDDEGGLPLLVLPAPHVGVSVLTTAHKAVGVGCPVKSGDDLVVLLCWFFFSPR